jgi:hypothetical protein
MHRVPTPPKGVCASPLASSFRDRATPEGGACTSPLESSLTIIVDDGVLRSICTHSSKAEPLANSRNTTPYGLPKGVLALILWGASVLKILKKPLGLLILCFLMVIEDHHDECSAVLWKADRRSAFQRRAIQLPSECHVRLSEGSRQR